LSDFPYVPMMVSEEEANVLMEELRWIRKQLWRKVDAVYRVLEVSEGEGVVFPVRFEVLQMSWDREAPGVSVSRIEGEVTQISVVPVRESMLPVIEKPNASVADLRFAFKDGKKGSRGLRYRLPDAQWITNSGDAFLQSLVADPSYLLSRADPRPVWRSWTAQIALIVVFTIAMLYYDRRRRCRLEEPQRKERIYRKTL
jgi:hypothetical protein